MNTITKNLMRKIFFLFSFFVFLNANAQATTNMSYQAVVRNASNALVTNAAVGVKISIIIDTPSSPAVYVETHNTTTNANGLINIEIGGGTIVTGQITGVQWRNSTCFLKTEIDPAGGTNYTISGTSQFLSVPYAQYATLSGSGLQDVLNSGNAASAFLQNSYPNAMILSSSGGVITNTAYRGLNSSITGTNGYHRAVQGTSNGANAQINYGVSGYATGATTLNNGVYGNSYSAVGDNYAIWGVASNAVNGKENRGVMGYGTTATATGLNYGITGWTGGSNVSNIAVGGYADAANSTNGSNYGLSARASATSSTGTNYGVYSTASGAATNYAGYFLGNVTITGTFVQPSDRKLKKEIEPIVSALDKIRVLEPVTYFYDTDKNNALNLPKEKQFGFIAQDLEVVFPNLVSKQVVDLSTTGTGGKHLATAEDGTELTDNGTVTANPSGKEEFKGINYTGLISILTQGIKEQQAQIEALKKQNSVLEKRIENLEKKK